MGPNELARIEENKAERQFEALKNKKMAAKFGEKQEMTDEAMLEWIDLNKQLQRDRDGNLYSDQVTAAGKSRSMFLENPLIPLGKYQALNDTALLLLQSSLYPKVFKVKSI